MVSLISLYWEETGEYSASCNVWEWDAEGSACLTEQMQLSQHSRRGSVNKQITLNPSQRMKKMGKDQNQEQGT